MASKPNSVIDAANEYFDSLIKSRFIEMFEAHSFSEVLFSEACSSFRNGANIKQTRGASGIPITRIETLSGGVFNTDRLGYANIFDERYSDYYLHNGDLLISHINSIPYVGKTVQYRGEVTGNVIHGMNLLCARLTNRFNPTFVEWYFKSNAAKDYISSITKKSVNQASISVSDLKKMKIPCPDIVIQNQFADFVKQVDKSKLDFQKLVSGFDELIKSRFIEMFEQDTE